MIKNERKQEKGIHKNLKSLEILAKIEILHSKKTD